MAPREDPVSMPRSRGGRRDWLVAGVGIAAGAMGAGWAWWKYRPQRIDAAPEGLWSLHFDAPTGEPLPMSQFKGRPLLVNFWATWCPPCIDELPLVDAFFKQNSVKSWQVLGLAVDQPSAVRKWLAARPLAFPVGMAGLNGTDLAKSLGNSAGGLPYTVVFDSTGNPVATKMGRLDPADLASYLDRIR